MIITDNDFALSFPDFLHNNLFGCLGSDATKLHVIDLFLIGIANGQTLIFFTGLLQRELSRFTQILFVFDDSPYAKGFVLTGIAIYRYPAVNFFTVV